MSSSFTTGDESYEKKTLFSLLLESVETSVQIFILGLTVLPIFGRSFSARTANETCLHKHLLAHFIEQIGFLLKFYELN